LSGGVTGRDALKDANIALKRAKKNRRGSYVVFSHEMGSDIRERVRLLQSLRSAVESERLFIVYQPQVILGSNNVVGVEALIRWRNEDGSFVPPDRFIPLAEASGMIVAIGDWVLRMSCHELVRLQALGFPNLRMSVNVSQIQFRHPEFLEKLNAALIDTKINPKCLELEITESVAMLGSTAVETTLASLREERISVALDDFGTGYSSLSYLDRLPLDRLKIDRAFVRQISDAQGPRIAEMITQLGLKLGVRIIAEGIENEESIQVLRAMGCHEGQGFHIGKPMPYDALVPWLAQYRGA
jgi:EAL domain-containing protein (putative c-di-GMP-specific phosphodiesterase class I)